MMVDKATALWNETVNFTIYYNNTGDAIAPNAKIKAQLPGALVFVTSDAEASRSGNLWNFSAVGIGSHSLKVTAKVFSGTPNNTVLTNIVTLTYSDSRGRAGLLSQANASVKVRVPIIPPPPKDTTSPTILNKSPAPNAKGIQANSTIQIAFSEPMNRSQTEKALTISPNLSGTITWSGNTLIFTPDAPFKAGQKYTISLNPGAKDLAGNELANPPSWEFTVTGKTTTEKDKWAGLCLPLLLVGIIVGAVVAALLVANRRRPKTSKMEYVDEKTQPSQRTMAQGTEKEAIDLEPTPKPIQEQKEVTPELENVQVHSKVEAPIILPPQPKEPEVPKEEPGPPKSVELVKVEPVKEIPAKKPTVEPSNEDKSIDEILKKLNG